jgi:Lytic transglycolase
MLKKTTLLLLLLALIISLTCYAIPARAESFIVIQGINNPTNGENSVKTPDDIATINFGENSLAQTITVKVMNILEKERIASHFNLPEKLFPQTDLYYFNFDPKAAGFNSQPRIKIKMKDSNYKGAYYYDWLSLQFIKASTTIDASSSQMIFDLPAGQTEIMFAAFGDQELSGTASWYVHPKYRGEMIAASTDFPFDTKLKVIAVSSGKEVAVTVKDYGPDKSVHPDRVVDLSKEAFSVLAPTGAGVIKVKVIPIY